MSTNLLSVIRIILLLLAAGFIVALAYKYVVYETFDPLLLTPIVGSLFFYFVTKPKAV